MDAPDRSASPSAVDNKGPAWAERSAGEWTARLMSMAVAEDRRETCVHIVSRIEQLLPQAYALSTTDKVRVTDMLESELEAKQLSISLLAYGLVKNDSLELKAKQEDALEFENRLMTMNNQYLREITNKRDMTRAGSIQTFEMVSAEGLVGGDVQFYEPLQHLPAEQRECVLSILEEKIKAIFDWDPTMKEKTSKVELAKFEDSLLRERLASYQRLNGQLREETRELRRRLKQAEQNNQKSSWEQQQFQAQLTKAKASLDSMRQELEATVEVRDSFKKDVTQLQKRLAKSEELVGLLRKSVTSKEGKKLLDDSDYQQQQEPRTGAAKTGEPKTGTVTCGVQTEPIQFDIVPPEAEREPSEDPGSPGSQKLGQPRKKLGQRAIVAEFVTEPATMGGPLEKRVYAAEHQAELAAKALQQRDDTIATLHTRIDALKASLAQGSLQDVPNAHVSAQDGLGLDGKGECDVAMEDASTAAMSRQVSFGSSSLGAVSSSPMPMSGSQLHLTSLSKVGATTSPSPIPGVARQGETKARDANEDPQRARHRADFADTVSQSLRDELEATQEQLAAAERRIKLMKDSQATGLMKELEAESEARKATNEELEVSRATLGAAMSRIRVLEAAIAVKDLASTPEDEDEEEEPTARLPTELENAKLRADAAQQFKMDSTLRDQKNALRNRVTAHKAQIDAMLQENQILHLALEEMQKEMRTITGKLRERLPNSQVVEMDVEALLKRMEKVAATGVGGYLRLYKQAHLREVGAVAVTDARKAKKDEEEVQSNLQDRARSSSRSPRPRRKCSESPAGARPEEDASPRLKRVNSDPTAFSIMAVAQFGTSQVTMARQPGMSGGSVARVRGRVKSPEVLRNSRRAVEPKSARELQAAGSNLGMTAGQPLGLPVVPASARRNVSNALGIQPDRVTVQQAQRGRDGSLERKRKDASLERKGDSRQMVGLQDARSPPKSAQGSMRFTERQPPLDQRNSLLVPPLAIGSAEGRVPSRSGSFRSTKKTASGTPKLPAVA